MSKRNRKSVGLDHNPNKGRSGSTLLSHANEHFGGIEEYFGGSEITVHEDGTVEFDNFKMHSMGVEILGEVPETVWENFGHMLNKMQNSIMWIIADWLAYGNKSYGDKVYERASEILGKSPATWEDYAYIARHVKFLERSKNLSLKHHKFVATYEPDVQSELLALAEEHSLSTRSFETIIPIYLDGRDWRLLLPEKLGAIGKAKIKFENERMKIREKVGKKNGDEWIAFAKEQAKEWQRLVDELED